MGIQDDPALRYFWQELQYLRQAGRSFARRYPKVANRLELEADVSPDPHVERLIESFAFLTGRIQRRIDDDFPEIAAELLGIVYPHFTHPIPSMAICRFDVDPERGKLTTGYRVPKHTPLFVQGDQGEVCRFRTCYPVDLWPIEVTEAVIELPEKHPFLDNNAHVAGVLRLRLQPLAGTFEELELKKLRFHLVGDRILATTFYELLLRNTLQVALKTDQQENPKKVHEPGEVLKAVGFGPLDEVLPYPTFAQPAYRLLQEYFVFPAKYYFFDLSGLQDTGAVDHLDVLFLLDHKPEDLPVEPRCFALGCTPIINLFPKTTEPVRVDHRSLEYLLVPDTRRWKTTEIHSIQTVSGSSNPAETLRTYRPFYSFDHQSGDQGSQVFWHAHRRASPHPDGVGTDLYLSFLDLDFEPRDPPAEVVYAHTLCTNRALAEHLPAGAVLQSDAGMPVKDIVCLTKPTRSLSPPMRGQTLWRLISHLSLNYLTLSEDEDSLKAFRETLRLYDFTGSPAAQLEINGVRSMTRRESTRRVAPRGGRPAPQGQGRTIGAQTLARGMDVTLQLHEDNYSGGAAFLFASVLRHFFGLYASNNRFVRLAVEIEHKEGIWHQWPPILGDKDAT